MDVIFVAEKGEAFAIEVGFFDTVLEIKEKIQKYHRIPIPKQTLVFNGRVLEDADDVEFCQILDGSRIQLLLSPSVQSHSPLLDHKSQSPLLSNNHHHANNNNNNIIHLNVNVNIPSNHSQFPIQIDPNDSVGRLKQRIHEIDAVAPIHRIMLQSNASASELQDQRSLRECDLSDNSEIEVCLRPSPPAPSPSPSPSPSPVASGGTTSKNKLKVMVMPKCGNSKIPVEVNPSDNVAELKKELLRLQQRLHFHLPPEGFFFIYDQDVMDEDRSFRWHGVAQGDTIEIFNGSVTGGS